MPPRRSNGTAALKSKLKAKLLAKNMSKRELCAIVAESGDMIAMLTEFVYQHLNLKPSSFPENTAFTVMQLVEYFLSVCFSIIILPPKVFYHHLILTNT